MLDEPNRASSSSYTSRSPRVRFPRSYSPLPDSSRTTTSGDADRGTGARQSRAPSSTASRFHSSSVRPGDVLKRYGSDTRQNPRTSLPVSDEAGPASVRRRAAAASDRRSSDRRSSDRRSSDRRFSDGASTRERAARERGADSRRARITERVRTLPATDRERARRVSEVTESVARTTEIAVGISTGLITSSPGTLSSGYAWGAYGYWGNIGWGFGNVWCDPCGPFGYWCGPSWCWGSCGWSFWSGWSCCWNWYWYGSGWNWCYPSYGSRYTWSPYAWDNYTYGPYAYYSPPSAYTRIVYEGLYGDEIYEAGYESGYEDGASSSGMLNLESRDAQVGPLEEGGSAPTAAPTASIPSGPGVARLNRAAEYYLVLGDRAFAGNDFGGAVHYYAKAIEFAPQQGMLFLLLSDALFATGDYHYSAYALRRSIELEPGLATNVVDKREMYTDAEDFDTQLARLEKFVEDHFQDSDARLVLTANYLFGGKAEQALELLESQYSETVRESEAGKLLARSARAVLGIEEPEAPVVEPAGSGRK